jgi:hypothetical protein
MNMESKPIRIRIPLCVSKNFPNVWPENGSFSDGKTTLVYSVVKPLGRKPKNGYKPKGYMQNYIFKEAHLSLYVFEHIDYTAEEQYYMFNLIWDFLDSLTIEEILGLSFDEVTKRFLEQNDFRTDEKIAEMA